MAYCLNVVSDINLPGRVDIKVFDKKDKKIVKSYLIWDGSFFKNRSYKELTDMQIAIEEQLKSFFPDRGQDYRKNDVISYIPDPRTLTKRNLDDICAIAMLIQENFIGENGSFKMPFNTRQVSL
jgi:hypothetical protein